MTTEEIRKANEAFLNGLDEQKERKESTKQSELNEYMKEMKGYRMTNWEIGFVKSVSYKTNLSEKQTAIVNKLYQKLIAA